MITFSEKVGCKKDSVPFNHPSRYPKAVCDLATEITDERLKQKVRWTAPWATTFQLSIKGGEVMSLDKSFGKVANYSLTANGGIAPLQIMSGDGIPSPPGTI